MHKYFFFLSFLTQMTHQCLCLMICVCACDLSFKCCKMLCTERSQIGREFTVKANSMTWLQRHLSFIISWKTKFEQHRSVSLLEDKYRKSNFSSHFLFFCLVIFRVCDFFSIEIFQPGQNNGWKLKTDSIYFVFVQCACESMPQLWPNVFFSLICHAHSTLHFIARFQWVNLVEFHEIISIVDDKSEHRCCDCTVCVWRSHRYDVFFPVLYSYPVWTLTISIRFFHLKLRNFLFFSL